MPTILSDLGISGMDRIDLIFSLSLASPVLFRSIGDIVIRWCTSRTQKIKPIGLTNNQIEERLITSAGFSNTDCSDHGARLGLAGIWTPLKDMHWNTARCHKDLSICSALLISFIRLILWYWLQPSLFLYTMIVYWSSLDDVQRILALIVWTREGIYVLFTLLGLCTCSGYLLSDSRSSKQMRFGHRLVYLLAPEKYICICILYRHIIELGTALVLLTLLDTAGMIALIWTILERQEYCPLLVNYGITTLAGILVTLAALSRRIESA